MSVYTVSDSVDYCRAICVGMPTAAVQVKGADMINSIMWNAYPWRWAQKALTAIPLVDGTQDYAFAPTDYMRMVSARLTRTDTTPDVYDELTVVRHLAPDLTKMGFRAGLSSICRWPATSVLRLNCAAAVPSGTTMRIDGEYQYQPSKIAAIAVAFPFPDQYFNVFCDGLLWQFYLLAKDSRAGTVQFTKNGAVYTGQMGAFYDSLMTMRSAEDWGAGDTMFPSEPLGIGGAFRSFSGIYGP